MTDSWKEINNLDEKYILNNKNYQIIKSILKDKNKDFDKIYKWCRKNIKNCWSVAQLKEYDYHITWRFWNTDDALEFQKKFKKYMIIDDK